MHVQDKQTNFAFNLPVKVDLLEVACYLELVFHMQYDTTVTPAQALLSFSLIWQIVV